MYYFWDYDREKLKSKYKYVNFWNSSLRLYFITKNYELITGMVKHNFNLALGKEMQVNEEGVQSILMELWLQETIYFSS